VEEVEEEINRLIGED